MLNLVMPRYLKVKDGDGKAGEVLQNQGKNDVETFVHDYLPKATLRGTVDEVCLMSRLLFVSLRRHLAHPTQ